MNIQNNAFDYTPKKSRAPKIIAQIVSVVFTAFMLLMFIVFLDSEKPEFISSESVNLYSTNEYDVYELRDLTVISNYESDGDYSEYYLVLLPDKDETAQVASLCCDKNSNLDLYIKKCMKDNNAETGYCVVNIGVTVSGKDMLYGSTISAYDNAVKNLKDSGMNVMSTELAFSYACLADGSDFEEYCHSEEVFNNVMIIMFFVLTLLGIVAAVFSFKESKKQNTVVTYYNPNIEQQY